MEFHQYLNIVLKHKLMILIMVVTASVGALSFTFLLDPKFEAATVLSVRPQDPEVIKTRFSQTKEGMGFPITIVPSKNLSETYSAFVTSAFMAEKILDEIGLENFHHTGPKKHWAKRAFKYVKDRIKLALALTWEFLCFGKHYVDDPRLATIRQINANLSSMTVKDTYLFVILGTAGNPGIAALLANTAADVFEEFGRELSTGEANERKQFLETHLKKSEDALADARMKIKNYKTENNIVDIDIRIEFEMSVYSQLMATKIEADSRVEELMQMTAELERELDKQQDVIQFSTSVGSSPAAKEARVRLASYEIDLSGLLERYTPDHPQVKEIMAKMEEARKILSEDRGNQVDEEIFRVNEMHQNLEQKIIVERANLRSAEERKKFLGTKLDALLESQNSLPEKERILKEMEVEVRMLESVVRP